MNVNSQF